MRQPAETQQIPEYLEAPKETIGALLLRRLNEGQLSIRHLRSIVQIANNFGNLSLESLQAIPTLKTIDGKQTQQIAQQIDTNLSEQQKKTLRELLEIPPEDPNLRAINEQEEYNETSDRIQVARMQVLLKKSILDKKQSGQLTARHLVVICQILDRYDLVEYIKASISTGTLSPAQAATLTLRAVDEKTNIVLILEDMLDVLEMPADDPFLKAAIRGQETSEKTCAALRKPENEQLKLQELARRLETLMGVLEQNLPPLCTTPKYSGAETQEQQFKNLKAILERDQLLSIMPKDMERATEHAASHLSFARHNYFWQVDSASHQLTDIHKTWLLLRHLYLLATKPLDTFLHPMESINMKPGRIWGSDKEWGEWYSPATLRGKSIYIRLLKREGDHYNILNLPEVDKYIKKVLFSFRRTTLTLEQTLYLTSALR